MSEAATNVASGEGFETVATPLFVTKRWAGMKEYTVSSDAYNKMRFGRQSGDRWANYIEDEALRNDVRNTFHGEEKFIVTCDLTGRSSIIRKQKIRKQAVMPEE